MMRNKSEKIIRKGMSNNCVITGIDLGDSSSLATVLSPAGEIADRFSFQMDEVGYALFSDKVPKNARLAFEGYEHGISIL